MNTVDNAKKLIKSLNRRKNIDSVDTYAFFEEDENWFFYISITGYIDNDYFDILICRSKYSKEESVKIIDTTDCEDKIRNILTKFDLITPY